MTDPVVKTYLERLEREHAKACRTVEATRQALLPGTRPVQERVRFVKPDVATKLALVRAPLCLQRRTRTWARKYHIAPHGHNAPEIRAMAAALFVHEGISELRARLKDLLSQCYPMPWTPGGYMGWLVVFGITENDGVVTTHTHLGNYSYDGGLEDLEAVTGLSFQPPLLTNQEMDTLRFIMDLLDYAHRELDHQETSFTLFEDGSVDLNVYGDILDETTKDWLQQEWREVQVKKRVERFRISKDRDLQEQLRGDPTFDYEMGNQEDEPAEQGFGAVALPRPSRDQQNMDERSYVRMGLKDIDIVQLRNYYNDRGTVDVLRPIREYRPFESKEGKTIPWNPWNLQLLQPHWIQPYVNAKGKPSRRGHPDLVRMFSGFARWAIEHGECFYTVQSRVDAARVSKTCPDTGEQEFVKNEYVRYRWITSDGENVRRAGHRRAWARCWQCTPGEHPEKRKYRGHWESPFKGDVHADVCQICGSEQAVVDVHVHIPLHYFADILHFGPFMRDEQSSVHKEDIFIRIQVYGRHARQVMQTREYVVRRNATGKPYVHKGSMKPVLVVEKPMNAHEWHGYGPDDRTAIIEGKRDHPQPVNFTWPVRYRGHQAPKQARHRSAYVDPQGHMHLVLDGIDWRDQEPIEGEANEALRSLLNRVHRFEMNFGEWMGPGEWTPGGEGWEA